MEAVGLPEFFEAYCTASVEVEHADHHSDGLGIEACEVAVDESCAELFFGQLTCASFIHRLEEWK